MRITTLINTGQQGSGAFGKNTRFTVDSRQEEKLQALQNMDIGDLIYNIKRVR
jgi:hypothetical protein